MIQEKYYERDLKWFSRLCEKVFPCKRCKALRTDLKGWKSTALDCSRYVVDLRAELSRYRAVFNGTLCKYAGDGVSKDELCHNNGDCADCSVAGIRAVGCQ